MLRPNVPVLKAVALLVCEGEHALGLGRELQLDRGGNLLAQGRASLYLLADGCEGGLRTREEARCQRLVLAHKAEQEVLGLAGGGTELGSLVSREKDDARSEEHTAELQAHCYI